MCGICGIISYNQNIYVDEQVIRRMSSALKHRGPDDEGVYLNNKIIPCVGLGHRRLSIIDLTSTGHQPMPNEKEMIWLVFNGEVYNYKDLRSELQDKGHVFRSNSDSETIIHLYEEYGPRCVNYLRGMFAFAIWDEREKILFLARDRLGKKPLLYYRDEKIFSFASEFTALLESGLVEKRINYKALDYYLTFGYIPAPFTIYENVFKLLPAHTLVLKNREILSEQYWQLDYSKKIPISEEGAAGEIMKLLEEAVRIRLYSDVPLGAFLSGGIDSSTVVALMSRLSPQKVKTFSIGFEDKDYSELKYARNIAEKFGTEHNEFIVKPKALEILPLLVERYGEPYADSSCIPSYYVAQQTRQYVTVALNGDGGDESFAGYERYQAMLLAQNLPNFTRQIINRLVKILPDSTNPRNRVRRMKRFLKGAVLPPLERYIRWVGIFDENSKKQIYSDNFSEITSNYEISVFMRLFLDRSQKLSYIDRLLWTDTMTYLPGDLLVKMDIATMANSLEARSPFLDHKLMEFAAKLPAEYKIKNLVKKYILKKATKGLLPYENIHRKKMGFGIPVGEWFRHELRGFLCDNLLSESFFRRDYFKPAAIKDMVKRHIEKKSDYSFQLWALLMLELWHKRFID